MTLLVHRARTRTRVTSDHTRIARIRRNIQSRIPNGAQLAHLESSWADDYDCDGCHHCIESDDLAYHLEFRVDLAIVMVRLHRECWEAWRIALPHASPPDSAACRREAPSSMRTLKAGPKP